jgi:hypothetical protein
MREYLMILRLNATSEISALLATPPCTSMTCVDDAAIRWKMKSRHGKLFMMYWM